MNKKWVVILVAVVVVVAAASFLVGRGSLPSNGATISEKDLFPKLQDVAGAPEIKLIGTEGLQLTSEINKEDWEKLGYLSLVVKVKNTSTKTLRSAVLVSTLYDEAGKVFGLKSTQAAEVGMLNPGAVFPANLKMMLMNTKGIGKVEFGLMGVVWQTASTSTPAPVTPVPKQTIAPPSTTPAPVAGIKSYYADSYPQNPQTPDEVLAAFFFLTSENKYLDAVKLIEKMESAIAAGTGEEKAVISRISRIPMYGGLRELRTSGTHIGKKAATNEDTASVEITAYFNSGGYMPSSMSLVKESGKWKVRLSNF